MNGDPHLDFIPQSLINWGVKNVAFVFLKMIKNRSEKLPDSNKKLIEEKKEFYDKVRERLGSIGNK